MNTDQFKTQAQDWLQRVWTGRLDARLPTYTMIIVLVLLTQTLASLTWKFVPVPEVTASATAGQVRRGNTIAPATKNQPLAGTIGQWHLFGQFIKNKPPPPVEVEVTEVPETRLNLKLRGVFASSNPVNASAIIADSKGSEESYMIGDELPGGAKLHQIFSDRVILDRNGRLETLKLPVDVPPSMEATGRESNARPSRQTSSPTQSSGFTPSASADTSETLRGIRDALVSDPQSVMGLVRAEPFKKNGKLAGYRIRPGKDRQLLRKFGLRSGDVVTAVNGVPMDNPLKALELMRDLKSATSISVDIERRGVPQSFSFQF